MSSTSSHACSSRPPRDSSPSRLCPKALLERARRDRRRCSRPPAGAGRSRLGRERHLRLLLHLGRLEGVQAGDVLDPAGRGVPRLRGVVAHARRVVTAGLRRLRRQLLGRPSPGSQQPHDESDARDRDDHGDGDDFLELAHSRRFSQTNPGAYDVSPGRCGWPGAAGRRVSRRASRRVARPGAAPGGARAPRRSAERLGVLLQHPGQHLLTAGRQHVATFPPGRHGDQPDHDHGDTDTEQQTENQGNHASRVPAARPRRPPGTPWL